MLCSSIHFHYVSCFLAQWRNGAINAETLAESVGDLSESYGNTNVEIDGDGVRGSLNHGAKGIGAGASMAQSGGRIVSVGDFGTHTVENLGTAGAFGSASSYSQTEGGVIR
ncbi:MAG: hypothetical protein GY696_24970 [Gammaproteobacteria bacterium]|nr:hypothetical protein [Gammaproteobacteria bacterium]